MSTTTTPTTPTTTSTPKTPNSSIGDPKATVAAVPAPAVEKEDSGTKPAPDPALASTKKATSKKRTKRTPSSSAGGRTLLDLAEAYVEQMEKDGKSEGTIFSYRQELRAALAALGEKTALSSITAKDVEKFFKSKRVTKLKDGRGKSPLSIAKTRRVLRLALCHAQTLHWIEVLPLPASEASH